MMSELRIATLLRILTRLHDDQPAGLSLRGRNDDRAKRANRANRARLEAIVGRTQLMGAERLPSPQKAGRPTVRTMRAQEPPLVLRVWMEMVTANVPLQGSPGAQRKEIP